MSRDDFRDRSLTFFNFLPPCFSLFRCSRCQWGIVPPVLLLSALCKINKTMAKAQVAERAPAIAAQSVKQVVANTAAPTKKGGK